MRKRCQCSVGSIFAASVRRCFSCIALNTYHPTSPGTVDIGGSLDFRWSSRTGAILVLPRGAAREELWNSDACYHHAAQNSERWFEHASRRRRTRDPGSLYFVTGHYKTNAYGLATVSDTLDRGSLKFSTAAPGFRGRASFAYFWEHCGTAITRAGPAQPGDKKNQCVFVSGFTITKQKRVLPARLRGKPKIVDITGAKIQDPPDPYGDGVSHQSEYSVGSEVSNCIPAEEENTSHADSEADNDLVVEDLSAIPHVRITDHRTELTN